MARLNSKDVDRDARKLDTARVKVETTTHQIIREQEAIVDAADEGIRSIESDLKAIRARLRPYTGASPKAWDTTAVDLKFRYENKLKERATLERAREVAEESIVAAKLHVIPGETDRVPKSPTEKGYHGLEV